MGRKEPESRFSSCLYECFSWVPVALSLLVCAALLALRPMAVSGRSMEPTLQNGDLMVVSAAACQPVRGDIIVLNKESFYHGQPIVKRVIAVEGDLVDIDFARGVVYLNGEALAEPYIREPTHTDEGTEFPLTVPEGCIFVMGDNRNESDDSRNPALGPVDTRNVIGRAFFLAVPGAAEETKERDWSRMGMLNRED